MAHRQPTQINATTNLAELTARKTPNTAAGQPAQARCREPLTLLALLALPTIAYSVTHARSHTNYRQLAPDAPPLPDARLSANGVPTRS